MALRTRVFAAFLRMSEKGIEEVVDLPAHRSKRLKVQRTVAGRFVFGRPDKDAAVEEITVGNGSRALVHRPAEAIGLLPCVLNFHGGDGCRATPSRRAGLRAGWRCATRPS